MSDTSRPVGPTDSESGDDIVAPQPVSAVDHAAVDHSSTDPAFVEPAVDVPDNAAAFASADPVTAEERADASFAPPTLVEPEPAPVVDGDRLPTGEVPLDTTAPVASAARETHAEPVVAEPTVVTPVATAPVVAAPVVAEPVVTPPLAPTPTGLPAVAPDNRVVYVDAPQPPRKRGNRGVGFLLALVATIVFAALYTLVILIVDNANGVSFDTSVFANVRFWVPVAFFAVGFILLALIANRASWWAYVIGSFLVALFVYFGSVGAFVLINNVLAMTAADAATTVARYFLSPGGIAAALLAREVSLWTGAAIAARGRRVKLRNVEAREAFDREQEEERARRDASYAPAP